MYRNWYVYQLSRGGALSQSLQIPRTATATAHSLTHARTHTKYNVFTTQAIATATTAGMTSWALKGATDSDQDQSTSFHSDFSSLFPFTFPDVHPSTVVGHMTRDEQICDRLRARLPFADADFGESLSHTNFPLAKNKSLQKVHLPFWSYLDTI